MTLIRLIQRASILAGMALASLPVHNNQAQADTPKFCVVASNGKTVCGTLKAVERACVTTEAGSTVCGKFKSAREEGQQEARNSTLISAQRKEIDNFIYTLEGCQRVETSVRCQIKMANQGKERNVRLYGSGSVLVDSAGKSHTGSQADLGGGPSSTNTPSAVIASNTDISIAITFANIPEQVVKAKLLNLNFFNGKPVQFRDISFSN
jgi:hypothetical protein